MGPSDYVFVTGMQRSGTTLLDKLLSSHPRAAVLSQPFPLVLVEAKRAFLRSRGLDASPYPLSDLFLETRYSTQALADFLDEAPLSRRRILELFREMDKYSGQYTSVERERLEGLSRAVGSESFAATVKRLYARLHDDPGAAVVGGKETLCEEFLPYLLERGFFGILVVRDPRDVIASLNYGKGRRFAGSVKPTLFNLRNWRKSVAFAIRLGEHPRFTLVRYEDLVREPEAQLDRLRRTLPLGPFPPDLLRRGLLDQQGRPWQANSSHEAYRSVSTASVGSYLRCLPVTVVRYTEAVCYPELRWLGYPLSIGAQDVRETIRSFVDPFELDRPELASFHAPERAAEELERWRLLREQLGPDTVPYFLFPEVQRRLAEQVAPSR